MLMARRECNSSLRSLGQAAANCSASSCPRTRLYPGSSSISKPRQARQTSSKRATERCLARSIRRRRSAGKVRLRKQR
eukprot:scaffold85_cov175-Ochromonas_danica.AAC.7